MIECENLFEVTFTNNLNCLEDKKYGKKILDVLKKRDTKKPKYYLQIDDKESHEVLLTKLLQLINSTGSRENGRKCLRFDDCASELEVSRAVLIKVIEKGNKEKKLLLPKYELENNPLVSLRRKMSQSFF